MCSFSPKACKPASHHVLPGLAYSLASKRGAAYVKERNFSTFHPATSTTYSIPEQRVIRVVLSDSGSGMLDLSTVCVACTITNKSGTQPLYLTGRNLACMFQRTTVRCKGVITDDVSYYHRLVGTLMNLRPLNSLHSDGPSQPLASATTARSAPRSSPTA